MIIKTKGKINNGIICNNKTSKYCGGGIQLDGKLKLNNGKVYKNWCNQKWGGFNHEAVTSKVFYDKDKIKSIFYNNKAQQKGNDIFPELE